MSTTNKTHDGITIRWAFQTSDWREYQERNKQVIRHAWRRSTDPGLSWVTLCDYAAVSGEPEFISRSNVPKCAECLRIAMPSPVEPAPGMQPEVTPVDPAQLYKILTPMNNGTVELAHVVRWRVRSTHEWVKDMGNKKTLDAPYPDAQYKCFECRLALPSNSPALCRHMRAVNTLLANSVALTLSR